MATFSKSFENNSRYTLILTVTEISNSTNIANNTTDINWELKITSGSSYFSKWTTRSEVIIDGEKVHSKNAQQSISANSSLIISSGTKTIKHNEDGNKTISCSATVSTDSTQTYLPGSATVTGNLQLSLIPRKSNVTCPSFNAGSSTNIVVSKKSDSFTSTIRYVFGSLSGTIATKTKDTVVGWKPNASDFYKQFPDDTSLGGIVYCDTYSGETLIGTSETSFTCYAVEKDCKPTITIKVIDVASNTKMLTDDENVIVKGMSNAKMTITYNLKNYANFSSLVGTNGDIKVNNQTEIVFENVNDSVFTAKIIDSRGYSDTVTIDKKTDGNFIDYTKLAFSSVNIGRTETTSNIINAELKGNYYNGNFSENIHNTLKLKFRYREAGGEWAGGIIVDEIVSLSPGDTLYPRVEIKYGQENLPTGVTATYSGDIMTVMNFNPITQEIENVADITVGESCFARTQINYGDTDLPEGYSATYDNENNMHIIGAKFISDYVELTPTISGNTFSYSGQLGDTFSYKKQYEFEFYAEDELMYVSASDKPIIVTKGISIIRIGDGYVDIRGDLSQNGEQLYKKGDSLIVADISCKNLFNKNDLKRNSASINVSILDTGIRLTATTTTGSQYVSYIIGTVSELVGETLTLSCNMVHSSSNTTMARLCYLNDVGSYHSDIGSITSSGSLTKTIGSSSAPYVGLLLYQNKDTSTTVGSYADYTNIQIEKGTVATEYTPFKRYGYNSVESMGKIVVDDIICRNILDLPQSYSKTANGGTLAGKNGVFTASGTLTTATTFYMYGMNIELKPGTYTLSSNSGSAYPYILLYNGSTKINTMSASHNGVETFTISENTTITRIGFYFASGTLSYTVSPQLERGSEKTSFTPYKDFGVNNHIKWNFKPETGINFNEYKDFGQYSVYGSCTNAPTTNVGFAILEVLMYSRDWIVQRLNCISESGNLTVYQRCFYMGTTWSAWKEI
jgi:hypothetical protein